MIAKPRSPFGYANIPSHFDADVLLLLLSTRPWGIFRRTSRHSCRALDSYRERHSAFLEPSIPGSMRNIYSYAILIRYYTFAVNIRIGYIFPCRTGGDSSDL